MLFVYISDADTLKSFQKNHFDSVIKFEILLSAEDIIKFPENITNSKFLLKEKDY